MNVLAIAPHPDDETIGCGGALLSHASRGDRVAAVFLTSGELGLKQLAKEHAQATREAEAAAAAEILGLASLTFLRQPDWFVSEEEATVAAALRPILQREAPDRIYLPHPDEWHPDHAAALSITRLALSDTGIPAPALLLYEVWTPLTAYDHVEDISAEMARKLRALRCYRSQVGHFRYDRAACGLNLYRGALAGRCRFAEVFASAECERA